MDSEGAAKRSSSTAAMAMSAFSISTLLPSFPKLRTLVGTPTPPGLVVECSSRPQKKATKHQMKTRPKKTQTWDIRRRPTVYAPLPPLPPDWTLVKCSGRVAEPPAVVASSAGVEQ